MASTPSQSGKDATESSELVEEKDFRRYLPLYKAALIGDWKSAQRFFRENGQDAVTAKISLKSETALHIAVATRKAIHFVEKLLELKPPADLVTLTNGEGETALHYAAMFGNTEAAKLLVRKTPYLLYISDKKARLPLHVAAESGHRVMVSYLLAVTEPNEERYPFRGDHGWMLVYFLIVADFYDLALQVVQRYPNLATREVCFGDKVNASFLEILAARPGAFPSGNRTRLKFWQRFVYSFVPVKFEGISGNPRGHYSKNQGGGGDGSPHDSENQGGGQDLGNQGGGSPCCCVRIFGGNLFKSVCLRLQDLLWKALEQLVSQIKNIKEMKLRHHHALQLVKCICKKIMELHTVEATSMFRQPVLSAAWSGINEIVEEILESFPSAIWSRDEDHSNNIFQLAVLNRRENVFNLLYKMSEYKLLVTPLTDEKQNTLLHLAGKLAPSHRLNLVPGAALQMQRELQWFEEVRKFVPPEQRGRRKNSDGKSPRVVFTEEHKELVREGERWMRDAANSCTVAATLIATVTFGASITVPGGNNGGSGFPIFSKEAAFIVFSISNALSLFSSSASLVMFLSILTARYTEADFLYSLPRRSIFGLVTLFLSITSMMIAFSATLYLVLGNERQWIIIPMAALACLPVTLFVLLQVPLLVDMIYYTYGPGIFGKRSDRVLS